MDVTPVDFSVLREPLQMHCYLILGTAFVLSCLISTLRYCVYRGLYNAVNRLNFVKTAMLSKQKAALMVSCEVI
jgi:hypothetical protein